MRIFITGGAGFIGSHLANNIKDSFEILSIDNFNSYYDVNLKKERLNYFNIQAFTSELDLCDLPSLRKALKKFKPDLIIHLAAQAGVRFSLSNPQQYIDSNISGFMNLLEVMKELNLDQLIYASSSSVYGAIKEMPYKESASLLSPQSYYALTKIHNEQTAKLFNNLYGINSLGLRFFTVYGSFGRPDMAYYDFSKKIKSNREISVFAEGKLLRDYTYIDDICQMIKKIVTKCYPLKGHDVLNLGNEKPRTTNELIKILENSLEIKARIKYESFQKGDVEATYSDTSRLKKLINFSPKYDLEQGIPLFIKWFKEHEQK